MTFDEAIKEIDEALDLIDYEDMPNKIYGVFNKLREEYAPTIEMTKEQHDYILPLIKEGKELGATFTEFWEVYEFMGASKKIGRTFDNQEQAMQVWLHPETIKVVDL